MPKCQNNFQTFLKLKLFTIIIIRLHSLGRDIGKDVTVASKVTCPEQNVLSNIEQETTASSAAWQRTIENTPNFREISHGVDLVSLSEVC